MTRNFIRISTELAGFIRKLLSFLTLFILLSGILGPWIVSSRLLYGFGFFIYGNLGKMVIISSIIFLLLIRNKLEKLLRISNFKFQISNKNPNSKIKNQKSVRQSLNSEFRILNSVYRFLITDNRLHLLLIPFSLLLIPVFLYIAKILLKEPTMMSNLPLTIGTHGLLILMSFLLIPGVFGFPFIGRFIREFKKEILICLGISVAFDVAIFQVWKLWPYFSGAVLSAVSFLLRLTFANVVVIPPRTLFVGNFAVEIAQACSGLDSLFLFSSLYLLIGILDWKKFHRTKLIGMFFPAAIGLFGINILRVYLLVIIGVLISPELAVQLFHTYAGMILFIIYFVLFWKLTYHWMQKK
jgi:exosortase/archaeosortase family protein